MGKTITTKIEFHYEWDEYEGNLTDEELVQRCAENFVDDIYSMVKHNELYDVALSRTTITNTTEEGK